MATRATLMRSLKGALRGAATTGAYNRARQQALKARLQRAQTPTARPKGKLPNPYHETLLYRKLVRRYDKAYAKNDQAGMRQAAAMIARLIKADNLKIESVLAKLRTAGTRKNGLFGPDASAKAKRVTKIRPVVDRQTGEKGEIVGAAPGGFVKVKWRNRNLPTLIQRSEIKKGQYRNPAGRDKAFLVTVSVNINGTWHTKRKPVIARNAQEAKDEARESFLIGGVDDTPQFKVGKTERVSDLVYNRHRRAWNPGLLDLVASKQAWDTVKKVRVAKNPSTSTRSEVRSPTRTSTSTKAKTTGNITVTGGAGRGATTKVIVKRNPSDSDSVYFKNYVKVARDRGDSYSYIVLLLEENFDLSFSVAKKIVDAERVKRTRPGGSEYKGKRNPSIREVSESFQGRTSNAVSEFKAAATAPADLARIGKLVFLKVGKRNIRVVGAMVAADTRGRLWIVANRAPVFNKKAQPGQQLDYGEVTAICYLTAKAHIGEGKTYEYVHEFGEEGGRKPHLCIDSDGMPVLRGGDYKITSAGIVN